VNGIIERRYF